MKLLINLLYHVTFDVITSFRVIYLIHTDMQCQNCIYVDLFVHQDNFNMHVIKRCYFVGPELSHWLCVLSIAIEAQSELFLYDQWIHNQLKESALKPLPAQYSLEQHSNIPFELFPKYRTIQWMLQIHLNAVC